MNRRNFITGLGLIPLAGSERAGSTRNRRLPEPVLKRKNAPISLGIIGFGFRGEQLARAANFAHPGWIGKLEKDGDPASRTVLDGYLNQQDLNVRIRGICDVYGERLQRGLETAGEGARAYQDYRDLLSDEEIDAVIIATPDHWHAKMSVDAARSGKHIYLEKCMTRTAPEAIEVRDAVRESGVVFQLGHQGRQHDLNRKARELIAGGTIGKITLVETTTNRNDPAGAWVYPVPDDLDARAVRWDLFQEPLAEKREFDPVRFFRWRCFWDYGTGLSGDLLTHEFDAVNAILGLGIPGAASASGGIYYYRDGREVPDVFHVSFEYPEQSLTVTYSATLANGISRGTLFMGDDATLELGRSLSVWVDRDSSTYRSRIEAGIIDPSAPVTRYDQGRKGVDAISSATSKYFADRGLLYTYREGTLANPTNLHLAEWIRCIRTGGTPSCNIEEGFRETIAAHMATQAYKQGRQVHWDPVNEQIT